MKLLEACRKTAGRALVLLVENIDAIDDRTAAEAACLIWKQMKKNVASALGLDRETSVNIKATTEEGLGFTGSGEGISAQAVCLLQPLMDAVADSRMYTDTGCPGCGGCARSGGEA